MDQDPRGSLRPEALPGLDGVYEAFKSLTLYDCEIEMQQAFEFARAIELKKPTWRQHYATWHEYIDSFRFADICAMEPFMTTDAWVPSIVVMRTHNLVCMRPLDGRHSGWQLVRGQDSMAIDVRDELPFFMRVFKAEYSLCSPS
jgi:hypothetical protein